MTHDQMLELWLLTRYHLPLNDPATVSVDSQFGVDTLQIEEAAMQAWYLQQLDTAPAALLPVEDCARSTSLLFERDGSCSVILPDRCRRPLSVQLSSWRIPTTIITPDHPLARLQASSMARGGHYSPVAVLYGRTLKLYSPEAGSDTLTHLMCVVDDSPTSYDLDPSLLSNIPKLL
ncbi:MAG: hypothetical protein K2L93_06905 [Muribaculaceae bacterium]|nr:hypothetical protein [Muribaculaceae bacterium]